MISFREFRNPAVFMPASDKILFACKLHNVLSESMLKNTKCYQMLVVAFHFVIFSFLMKTFNCKLSAEDKSASGEPATHAMIWMERLES